MATPATAERPAPIASSVVIHLHSLPAASRTATMGVATFDATNGSGFVWTPLTAANEQADGSLLLRATVHDTSEQSVTFATDRAFARHGYLARSRFVPDRRSGEVAVSLDATTNLIRFELPPTATRAGPLRIVRLDDPTWMPMEHGTTGLSVTSSGPTTVLFGAGEYELQDPLVPERTQRFVVPASGPVVLSPSLTVARAGRP